MLEIVRKQEVIGKDAKLLEDGRKTYSAKPDALSNKV